MVSALELLAGLDGAFAGRFREAKEQIDLAYELSKGRVLEEPVFLLCKEVLRVPFPAKLERPRPEVIADYMQVVRCADSLEQIRAGRVPVKKLRSKGGGRAGFAGLTAPVVKELLAGPKREWVEGCEAFVSEIYPQWREHLQQTGKRLPDQIRKELKTRHVWHTEKAKFTESKLTWLEARTTPELIAGIAKRLDAVLEFTIFVTRETLLGNYNIEKHDSDVYDQFQLHYLALEWSRGVARWFRRSLSVSDPFVCRCLTSSAMLPFPHPAHRTGQADLPHPALGEDSRDRLGHCM